MTLIYRQRAQGEEVFTGITLVDNCVSDALHEARVATTAELIELQEIIANRIG
jgi:hypothetical protein